MAQTNQVFILAHDIARQRAQDAVRSAPSGYRVVIGEPRRNLEQNDKMHAMIGDIAKQYRFCDRLWDAEDMKRLLIDAFKRETFNDPDLREAWQKVAPMEMAPSINGAGVVMLGVQSRRFPKRLASAFVEWLAAFGGENSIVWTPYHGKDDMPHNAEAHRGA